MAIRLQLDASNRFNTLMSISLEYLRQLDAKRWPTPTALIFDNPATVPLGVMATGERNLIRVQWVTIDGADGYDVAVMTTPNLAAPDVNLVNLPSSKVREYVYNTGNNALTRYFAVRSRQADAASPWSSVVNATSNISIDNDLSSASTAASTSSTSETILRTITMNANTLGANDGIHIQAWGRFSVSVGTSTVRIRWGGISGTILASTNNNVTSNYFLQGVVFNRNATNSQFLGGVGQVSTSIGAPTNTTATLDTTANQDLVITGENGTSGTTFVDLIDTFIVRGSASISSGPPPSPPGNPPSGSEHEAAGRGTR